MRRHLPRPGVAPRLCWHGHSPLHLDPVASNAAARPLDIPVLTYRSQLLQYELARGRHRYLSGHYPYHHTLCAPFAPPWMFMTVLRDPEARWFSNYFYNRYKTTSTHFRINESLEAFLDTDRARQGGNLYARFLSFGTNTKNPVAHALRHLSHFHIVGVLEHLPLLLADCQQTLGVRLKPSVRNTSPRSKEDQSAEITPAIRARVQELCQPDIEIYTEVKRRLETHGSWHHYRLQLDQPQP